MIQKHEHQSQDHLENEKIKRKTDERSFSSFFVEHFTEKKNEVKMLPKDNTNDC